MEKLCLSQLDKQPKGATVLFKIMMRFEYALKDAGFISNHANGAVKVDWDSFANHGLSRQFFGIVNSSGFAKTLITNPPSRQIVRFGCLDFDDAASPTDNQQLIGAVCRVRNNLFHGGKSGDRDHERNDELISDAIYVIEEAIKSHTEVKFRFEGKY